jgi:hypothetical protein
MKNSYRWSRILAVVGVAGMVLGAIDPLEGAFVILPAAALVALSAFLAKSSDRVPLYFSAGLITLGVAALLILSALGGFGGDSGRLMWWVLVIAPYPIGWLIGLAYSIRYMRSLPASVVR